MKKYQEPAQKDKNNTAPQEAKTDKKQQEAERPVTRRYGKNGKRRGKYAYAAPLGFLISLLAVIGVVALVFTGVTAVRRSTDTTELKGEMYYFLEPVLLYTPTAFEDVTKTEQDVFLNAAAYRVMQAEQIRMLREKDESCRYAVDDAGRIAVPAEEIKTSYAYLFGPDAPLKHRSLEASGLEYSEADGCYYVPFEVSNSAYVFFIDSIQRKSGKYLVRVGFVPTTDIPLDEHGNDMKPTAEMASHFQTYTLTRTKTGYYISACADS